jgi:hypothetical protein
MIPALGSCVEYAEIDAAYHRMTSVEWKDYVKSIEGTHACWSGIVVDVKGQWFGGYKILVGTLLREGPEQHKGRRTT